MSANSWREIYEEGGVAALSQGFLLMAYRFAEQGPGLQTCFVYLQFIHQKLFKLYFSDIFLRDFLHTMKLRLQNI